MTTTEVEDLTRVWDQVKNWPARLQVSLARRLLDVLDAESAVVPVTRGVPVSDMIGMGAGSGEPPSDAQVRQWVDEHRREKYGS